MKRSFVDPIVVVMDDQWTLMQAGRRAFLGKPRVFYGARCGTCVLSLFLLFFFAVSGVRNYILEPIAINVLCFVVWRPCVCAHRYSLQRFDFSLRILSWRRKSILYRWIAVAPRAPRCFYCSRGRSMCAW